MELLMLLTVAIAAGAASPNKAHLSKDQSVKVMEYSMDCIKKTGVGMDVISDAKRGNFADDENLKKFTLCFFQKTGIMSSDGKLNEEVALAKLPAEVDRAAVKKVLDACKNKTGKDAADTAFEIFKCYYKATPTHVTF